MNTIKKILLLTALSIILVASGCGDGKKNLYLPKAKAGINQDLYYLISAFTDSQGFSRSHAFSASLLSFLKAVA